MKARTNPLKSHKFIVIDNGKGAKVSILRKINLFFLYPIVVLKFVGKDFFKIIPLRFFAGAGASPAGQRPFFDLRDVKSTSEFSLYIFYFEIDELIYMTSGMHPPYRV